MSPVDRSLRVLFIASLGYFVATSLSAATCLANPVSSPEILHIDKFGQDAETQWREKIHSTDELKAIDSEELNDIQTHPSCSEWDHCGAWKNGPTLPASGFFSCAEVEGKWWFVSPEGKLFYSLGLDCVAPGAFSPVRASKRNNEKKLEILANYDWLPEHEGEYAAAYKGEAVSFYLANLQRKWGKEWRRKFDERSIIRLKSWCFNSLGNWSDISLHDRGVPYFSMGPSTWELKIQYIDGDIPDVYDPSFEKETIRVCSRDFEKTKSQKWLVGYFLDNELPWFNIPYDVFELEDTAYCKVAWLAKLKARYANIESLNKAWGISANSFEKIKWTGKHPTPQAKADMSELLGEFAAKFYAGWYKAIKQADPNHLVLGSRIPYPMKEVVDACARNTDVLSFNHYGAHLPKEYDEYYRKYRKPMLIGEFDFDSLDAGLRKAFVPVKNQKQRGVGYKYYTQQAAAKEYMVGTHYFQYVDEPLTGREDGESSFNGFLSVTDRPYSELVSAARESNCKIYLIHSRKLKPTKIRPARQ